MRKADNLPPYCAVVKKTRSLNFLDPSGPAWPVTGVLYLLCIPAYTCFFSVSNSSCSPGILNGPTIPSTSEVNGTACKVHCFTPFTNTPSWGRYAQEPLIRNNCLEGLPNYDDIWTASIKAGLSSGTVLIRIQHVTASRER